MPERDEVRLADGTSVVVRPITPDDAGALVDLHAQLSTDAIYRRYSGARRHLSPADVDRFPFVDGPARLALVAMRGAGRRRRRRDPAVRPGSADARSADRRARAQEHLARAGVAAPPS